MKRLRLFFALLLAVGMVSAVSAPAACAAAPSFSFYLGSRNASAGETVALRVTLSPAAAVAGFRVRASYDDSVLQFAGVQTPPQIETGTLRTNADADPVCSIYVCNVDKGYAPQLSGTVLTYLFQVKAGAPAGATNLCASVDETCDFSAKNMYLDNYETLALNVNAGPSSDASLTALEPSQGELDPPFSPEVLSYRLPVDAAVQSVAFRASAAAGAGVKIDRKSLFAAGSDTPIEITVTAADGKTQEIYRVTVSRAAKAEEEKVSSVVTEDKSRRSASSRAARASAVHTAAEQALTAAKKSRSASVLRETDAAPVSSAAVQKTAVLQTAANGTSLRSPQNAALTIVQNQTSPFAVGMLAAGFCILLGIVLSHELGLKK